MPDLGRIRALASENVEACRNGLLPFSDGVESIALLVDRLSKDCFGAARSSRLRTANLRAISSGDRLSAPCSACIPALLLRTCSS